MTNTLEKINIYEEISKILNTYLTRETIDRDIKLIDASGAITQKKLFDIIMALIKYVDQQSNEKTV